MSIFEDKSKMPEAGREARDARPTIAGPGVDYPRGDAPVQVCMTPKESRDLSMSNYPRYDAMDVINVMRPRRGHDV